MQSKNINISKHISELLYSYECVILPSFGGFISNYKSALLSADGRSIIPPTKAISFNKNLNKSDGLLINYVAEQNDITYARIRYHFNICQYQIRVF